MRELINRYIAAYNRIDIPSMLATTHTDVIFENYTHGHLALRTQGKHELQHLAQSSSGLFSARQQTITGYAEIDGTAQVEIFFEGVFALDLPNGVRKGQRIAMPGRSQFRERDGLLIYVADFSD